MKRPAPFALIVWIVGAYQVQAQAPQVSNMQSPGARAGNSVVPSTHSPGCGGVLCDGDDPRRVAAVPPPPCDGLLCSLSPYAMAPPVTASSAARAQDEQTRAQAAAAAPPPAPEKVQKRRRAKAKTNKTVAVRTPDPSLAPPAPTGPQ